MELGLFLILLVNIGLISATVWINPIFTKPDKFPCDRIHVYEDEECKNWDFDPTNKIRTLYIKFEEEQKEPILITYLYCTDCDGKKAPQIGEFTDDSGTRIALGPEIKEVETGKYSLTITKRLDYELKEHRVFKFTLVLEGAELNYNMKIDLLDIDDEKPQITVHQTPCEIPENIDGETNCTYSLTDPDTNGLKDIEFVMPPGYEEHFEIILHPKNNNEADAVLFIRNNKSLDFEAMPMYFFELTGIDLGKNEGKALIMIKVKDMNDRPPRWVDIFAVKSFDEHKVEKFTVYAQDGDLEINDKILYSWKDDICHENIKLIPDGEKAIISIEGIERDTQEMEDKDNTIKCTLIASEESSDLFKADTEVSFIIQDINDNKPLITLATSANSPIILREEEFTTLDKIFAVNDIDQGNNAQFEVSLENTAGDILKIDYGEPFQVIPNNGYKNWDFSISVVNADLLDYDANDDWREFSLTIHSTDKGDKPQNQNDVKKINIELMNLNDEIPIFDEETNYTVEIPEDAPKETYILNVIARDADYNDHVEYDLLLGSNEYKLAPQKNDSITLYTTRDNVFDFEKLRTVFIQITATDTLQIPGEADNFHKVTQQITVSVIDVNDEKPRINLPPQTSIDEHVDIGTTITDKITAEDVDTSAYLNFSINWKNSRVSKQGVQSTNISLFEDVFSIETVFPDESKTGYAEGILKVNDKETLDYEVFDTIFLNIQVEDLHQKINIGTDEGTLTIIINDINDNAPEFDMDTINSEKIVTENSKVGLKIATITAFDIDGPKNNDVRYYLEPRNNTAPGLVQIDEESGELTVASDKIDADGPAYTYYLYYDVIATDKKYFPKQPIEIFIEDQNEMTPFLKTPLQSQIQIQERESTDAPQLVQQIDGMDWDRDEPHDTIKYELDNEITQLGNMFSINPETGEVHAYGKIEWDNDIEMAINFFMEDNIGGSGKHNVEKFKFTVIITDIDNNPPILPKPSEITIETREDAALSTEIAKIIATDKDKPCTSATKIEYKILEIKDSKDNVIAEKLFELQQQEGAPPPKCEQIAKLKIKTSLKNHYGKIFIKISAQNSYTPENQNEETYEITVEAANYKPPKILIPEDSMLILQKEQTAGNKLIAIDGKYIKDFLATDDQEGKFEMRFEPGDSLWDNVFELINKPDDEKNYGRLTLTVNTPPKKEYTLQIKARHNGTGDPQNFVTKTLTVKFLDENQLPSFEKLEAQVEFWENETKITCATFPSAKDPKCGTEENDNCLYKTHYHIINIQEKVNFKTSNSDKDYPQLCLEKWLDREKQPYHYLTVVATNDEGPPPSVPDGYDPLKITVKVLDINDNPPAFVKKLFKGGLLDTDKRNTEIVTLEATDPDEVDQGKLRYKILKETITTSHSSLDTIKNDIFEIEGDKIKNALQPSQAMEGYFLFKVQVLDTLNYSDTAEVKIHIISDANRVIFKFNEDIDSVKAKEEEIENIFSKELKYSCTIDEFMMKINETETRANSYITEVKTHFINDDDEPVEKEIITVKLDDLTGIVSSLRIRLSDIGLTLIYVEASGDLEDETQDMYFLLKILLIVVSVVLGTLCIILIVAFILRTRSLNKRLAAMTTNVFGSTKSDLNRVGISAPGTNRHAIEANPVWNEGIDNNEFDAVSQASDESDLIGVEDQPDFASYDYGRPSINPVIQQHLQKRSRRNDDDDDIRSLPGSDNNSTINRY